MRIHTHALTDQRGVRRQRRIVHPARREEIAFGSPMQQQKPIEDHQFIYRPRTEGVDRRTRARRHGARARARHVRDGHEGDGAHHGRLVGRQDLHTQKLHPSNNNNEYDGSGRNGHRSPTTPMTNLEREINILEKLDHPTIFRLSARRFH